MRRVHRGPTAAEEATTIVKRPCHSHKDACAMAKGRVRICAVELRRRGVEFILWFEQRSNGYDLLMGLSLVDGLSLALFLDVLSLLQQNEIGLRLRQQVQGRPQLAGILGSREHRICIPRHQSHNDIRIIGGGRESRGPCNRRRSRSRHLVLVRVGARSDGVLITSALAIVDVNSCCRCRRC